MRDCTITINDLRFSYLEWSNAEAESSLLLLPGADLSSVGGSRYYWRPFADAMSRRYRVIALDPRGHGESEWASEYRWDLILHDIEAFAGKVQLGTTSVIGHWSAAWWGLLYAARHPEQVDTVVAVDPPVLQRAAQVDPRAEPPGPDVYASLTEAVDRTREEAGADATMGAIVRDWVRHATRPLQGRSITSAVDPRVRQALVRGLLYPPHDEMLDMLRGVRCRALIVLSTRVTDDGAEPSAEQADCLARAVPDGSLETLEGARIAQVGSAEAFVDRVGAFLEAGHRGQA